MPQAIKDKSSITVIEIDRLTSEMVQSLYPDIHHYNMAFEKYHTETQFDLIIGNPPYGAQTVEDTNHPDLQRYCIHHYFVAKCMRLLKPNGILTMVLPSFFLDNSKDHVRYIINREGGSLLAAYRLPDDLFVDAKVTVDIVFLTKGKTNNKWLKVNDITIGDQTKPMNEYFHHNSHHILGNLEIIDMYERKGLTCKRRGLLSNLLEYALESLKQERFIQLSASLLESNNP